ncbi:putative isomerase YbhE [Dichomitus squalens LYAD-421 SS1]|uniref:putative isomerase YbhE n=1 Tax=Dichomitus squalens (strain LYAD-421) TaxID=732165 RepID=UPI000441469B|nr:putative isomerase YbhE [Dichomitus squalens LYAD-421 SS1]EJF63677.1 putative isomerase YbhE [Dichomitus squalens LYAD-421 SS1]
MVNFTILAGGYSSAIVTYLFNSDAGALSVVGQSPTGTNPSWIALHPTNQSILYATNENTEGGLQSFVIKNDGLLTDALATVSSGGNGPAFAVPLSTGEVAGMNFGSGNGVIVPTEEDPTQFVSGAPVITFPAPPSPAVSHPHMALEVGSEVFVPDLGADTIHRLVRDGPAGNFKVQGEIEQPAGSGPRHIVVRGDQLYTIHELASTLTQQTIPADPSVPAAPLAANLSIVPPGLPAGASMAAAELLLAEASPAPGSNFTQAFLYASNRNVGAQDPRGDAIAIFALEPQLALVKHVFTGLDQIRGMQLSGGPENEYVVAAGVAGSAGTVVLRRTNGGADLEIVATNTDVPTRSSFVWLSD